MRRAATPAVLLCDCLVGMRRRPIAGAEEEEEELVEEEALLPPDALLEGAAAPMLPLDDRRIFSATAFEILNTVSSNTVAGG